MSIFSLSLLDSSIRKVWRRSDRAALSDRSCPVTRTQTIIWKTVYWFAPFFSVRILTRKVASAEPLYCASVTFVSGRERERDACDVIDITLKSRVIMHMITSTARRPNASTRSDSEPVERSNFEVHVKTRSLALERSIEQQGQVIDERRWGSGSFAFAGQTAVDHPAAFRWHASSKKNRPS